MNRILASCGHYTVAIGAPASPARTECESNPCWHCQQGFETKKLAEEKKYFYPIVMQNERVAEPIPLYVAIPEEN